MVSAHRRERPHAAGNHDRAWSVENEVEEKSQLRDKIGSQIHDNTHLWIELLDVVRKIDHCCRIVVQRKVGRLDDIDDLVYFRYLLQEPSQVQRWLTARHLPTIVNQG